MQKIVDFASGTLSAMMQHLLQQESISLLVFCFAQEVIVNTVSSANDFKSQMALLRPNGSLCIVSGMVIF